MSTIVKQSTAAVVKPVQTMTVSGASLVTDGYARPVPMMNPAATVGVKAGADGRRSLTFSGQFGFTVDADTVPADERDEMLAHLTRDDVSRTAWVLLKEVDGYFQEESYTIPLKDGKEYETLTRAIATHAKEGRAGIVTIFARGIREEENGEKVNALYSVGVRAIIPTIRVAK